MYHGSRYYHFVMPLGRSIAHMLSLEYQVVYYVDPRTGRKLVQDYLDALPAKVKSRAITYMKMLQANDGRLDEPYARHIVGSIRELRVDFARDHYRILYFAVIGRRIIMLHAFKKNTPKTPLREIEIALRRHDEFLSRNTYE